MNRIAPRRSRAGRPRLDASGPMEKHRIGFCLPPELHERIRALATDRPGGMSRLVREIVEAHLARGSAS